MCCNLRKILAERTQFRLSVAVRDTGGSIQVRAVQQKRYWPTADDFPAHRAMGWIWPGELQVRRIAHAQILTPSPEVKPCRHSEQHDPTVTGRAALLGRTLAGRYRPSSCCLCKRAPLIDRRSSFEVIRRSRPASTIASSPLCRSRERSTAPRAWRGRRGMRARRPGWAPPRSRPRNTRCSSAPPRGSGRPA